MLNATVIHLMANSIVLTTGHILFVQFMLCNMFSADKFRVQTLLNSALQVTSPKLRGATCG